MPAKVSICLPVYNGGKFLAKSIASVVAQDYADWELLIADDCSSDDSFDIIESLARQDVRIRYWRNETNLGLFENYNRCIERSQGEFIKPFAQDDLLHEKNISTAVALLSENPSVSLVANGRIWIDENDSDISEFVSVRSSDMYVPAGKLVPGREVIRESLFGVVNFIGEPSCVMFRKQHGLDGFDSAYHHLGDLDFWLRILTCGDYFFTNEVLSYFRMHDQSRSAENVKQFMVAPDLVRLAQRFEPMLEELGSSYEKLLRKNFRALSDHALFLMATNEISAADFKANEASDKYLAAIGSNIGSEQLQSRVLNDLLAFRELLFYGFRELSVSNRSAAGSSKLSPGKVQEIAVLEARLEALLRSPSWRITRVLREYNANLVRGQQRFGDTDMADGSLEDADDYRRFLHQQISAVKRSRSWKITRHLRRLGIL